MSGSGANSPDLIDCHLLDVPVRGLEGNRGIGICALSVMVISSSRAHPTHQTQDWKHKKVNTHSHRSNPHRLEHYALSKGANKARALIFAVPGGAPALPAMIMARTMIQRLKQADLCALDPAAPDEPWLLILPSPSVRYGRISCAEPRRLGTSWRKGIRQLLALPSTLSRGSSLKSGAESGAGRARKQMASATRCKASEDIS